jgi:hypothetical protein
MINTNIYSELPTPLQLDVAELLLEEVLDRRLIKCANASYLQVLIKWTTLPASLATWEDYIMLHRCFPDAAAWEQAASRGDSRVTIGEATGTGHLHLRKMESEKCATCVLCS